MSTALAIQPKSLGAHNSRAGELHGFLIWIACWIVLPNLPFLPITLMGGPPRFMEILVGGIVGLVARRLPYWAKLAAFAGLMVWLLAEFISSMFNMGVTMILSVAGLVFDLSPTAAPEYVAGAGLLALSCGAAAWLLLWPAQFRRPALLAAAVAATLGAAAADYAISRDTMGAYTRLAPEGAPFTSATEQAGLLGLADGKTNVMLVMVEAMGQPRDPAMRELLEDIWMRPELAKRFEMTRGETPFYGSTTSGEIRELCGRWGDYPEIAGPQGTCLPALLAERGYRSTSYHAFLPHFFERQEWYPHVGFDRSRFGPELTARGAGTCRNVFPGACDRDIPAIIHQDLESAGNPQFIYWLTLNSHLPVIESEALGTDNCHELGGYKDAELPMVCRLFALWRQTADALAATIARPDFPPTHILIVGDHMPPFTQQRSRLQFDAERVPWILLRDKRAQPPASGAAE